MLAGSVVSRTVRGQPAALPSERLVQHLRREAGTAHPQQRDVFDAVGRHPFRERGEIVGLLGHRLGHGEPAEAVLDLGRLLRPQRVVAGPDAMRDVGARELRDALVDGCGKAAEAGRGLHPPAGDHFQGLADAPQQALEVRGEGGQPFLQQPLPDRRHVDAGLAELPQSPLRLRGVVDPGRGRRLAVIGEGAQRRLRHRVDGVRRDQILDVQHVAVRRVLRARGSPERALHARSGFRQPLPARAVKDRA